MCWIRCYGRSAVVGEVVVLYVRAHLRTIMVRVGVADSEPACHIPTQHATAGVPEIRCQSHQGPAEVHVDVTSREHTDAASHLLSQRGTALPCLHACGAFAAGAFPRASEQEVMQLLGQLPKAVKARVAAAYKVSTRTLADVTV